MKRFLLTALLSASAPLAAQPQPEDKQDAIIVTGRSLGDTARRLAECLARKCPPNEDIDASLAHAENLFVAGEYKQARSTSKTSLGRNRKHAARFPVDVSDLERANGRISAHLGEGYDYQYSTWGIRRALKQGLPDTDPRLIGASLEIASMLFSTGRTQLAQQTYSAAELDALKIGRRDLAATARLRSAWVDHLDGNPADAKRKLNAIAQSADPMERVPRIAAMVLLARLDRAAGLTTGADKLVAELAGAKLKQPFLIYMPPIELAQKDVFKAVRDSPRDGLSDLAALPTDTFEDKWIDVGFWVQPDGRVTDLEILRKRGETGWSKPLMKALGGRIYSATDANGVEGTYRIERYSYTSFWDRRTGTRIRQRGADSRVEFLDLTANPEAASNGAKPETR